MKQAYGWRLYLSLTTIILITFILADDRIQAIESNQFCADLLQLHQMEEDAFKMIRSEMIDSKSSKKIFSTRLILPGADNATIIEDDEIFYTAQYGPFVDTTYAVALFEQLNEQVSSCLEDLDYSPNWAANQYGADEIWFYLEYTELGVRMPDVRLELTENLNQLIITLKMLAGSQPEYQFFEPDYYGDVRQLGDEIDHLLYALQFDFSEVRGDLLPKNDAGDNKQYYTTKTGLTDAQCTCVESRGNPLGIECILAENANASEIRLQYDELKPQVLTALGNYFLVRELESPVKDMPPTLELVYVEEFCNEDIPLISFGLERGISTEYVLKLKILKKGSKL